MKRSQGIPNHVLPEKAAVAELQAAVPIFHIAFIAEYLISVVAVDRSTPDKPVIAPDEGFGFLPV